jgi:hypothetical protein
MVTTSKDLRNVKPFLLGKPMSGGRNVTLFAFPSAGTTLVAIDLFAIVASVNGSLVLFVTNHAGVDILPLLCTYVCAQARLQTIAVVFLTPRSDAATH